MKLNFWQWLAVVLLIIGCVIWIYERSHPKDTSAGGQPTTGNITGK